MKPWQEVLTTLLSEFDEICTRLGIDYCTADRLAWDVVKFQKFHDTTYDAYVTMRSADLERFLQELEHYPNREYERFSREGAQFFHYVASDTILIDLDAPRSFRHPGIALTVQLVGEPDTDGLVRYFIDDDELRFSPEVFFPAEKGTFEGLELNIPRDIDTYFTALVCSEWKDRTYTRSISRVKFHVLFDTGYGYQKFLEEPLVQEMLAAERKQEREYYLQKELEAKPFTDKTEMYKNASALSYWRFQFWEMYYPQRLQIKEYLEANDSDALSKLLEPCVVRIRHFTKRGFGLYFDASIHEALLVVCREKYGDAFVEEWVAAIPEPHYEGVADVLRREGVAHPLLSE